MSVDRPKITLTKRATKAFDEPVKFYEYAMLYVDDLVWLLEPAQNKLTPKKFKEEVRLLVGRINEQRKKASGQIY